MIVKDLTRPLPYYQFALVGLVVENRTKDFRPRIVNELK